MGFWIYMLIMSLLLPLTMIGFGWYFRKKAPGAINAVFGYRTAMSMKNWETWKFAHQYCGKIWVMSGLILLPVSVLVMLLVLGESEDTIGFVGTGLCLAELIPLVITIVLTEKALRKNFDQFGLRRTK